MCQLLLVVFSPSFLKCNFTQPDNVDKVPYLNYDIPSWTDMIYIQNTFSKFQLQHKMNGGKNILFQNACFFFPQNVFNNKIQPQMSQNQGFWVSTVCKTKT